MDTTTISGVPTMSDEEALSRFANELIEAKGLGGLVEAEKAELAQEIEEKFIDRVYKAVIFALPRDKFEELQSVLAEAEDDEAVANEAMAQIDAIVESAGIDMQKIVTETAADFRRVFLGGELNNLNGEEN